MKWKRNEGNGYFSEDGQLWIHRFWPDKGDENKMRTYWDICFLNPYGDWMCENTVRTLADAKEWAEKNLTNKKEEA